MIFITVGSRSFQFDRLIKAVDNLVKCKKIDDKIFAQVGSGNYRPTEYEFVDYMDHGLFNQCLDKSDIVITHGGTGIIVNALKKGKKVIAVPRLAEYDEVVDNHQLQLVREFEKMGMITACYDCSKIAGCIDMAKVKGPVYYQSNTDKILDSITKFISELGA